MTLHICPVCGKPHAVTPARQSVAWGRPLCCSCACEVERRRRVREQLLDASHCAPRTDLTESRVSMLA